MFDIITFQHFATTVKMHPVSGAAQPVPCISWKMELPCIIQKNALVANIVNLIVLTV